VTAPLDSSADSTAHEIAQRYGTDRPRRRGLVIALAAVLGAAFLAWVAWAAWFHSDPAVNAAIVSYDVVGAHEMRVKVDAHFRDAEADGTCLVRAIAADHTVVGELNLSAADLREAKGSWIPIRTERRATAAELVRCTDSG
jgi:hypothetical protein